MLICVLVLVATLSSCYADGCDASGSCCRRTCKDVVSYNALTVATLWDGLQVLCDTQSDGGGWTVIQRRSTGDLDFFRTWAEYRNGFGNISIGGEFWLGNENIHRISSRSPHELRVDFKFNGEEYFARYSSFRVFSEAEKYQLSVAGYSGNAGDSLIPLHNGMKFSTKDQDNDGTTIDNCASSFKGAWWYQACHQSNLNGLWNSTAFGRGVNWLTTTTYTASATFTEMKIRPIN